MAPSIGYIVATLLLIAAVTCSPQGHQAVDGICQPYDSYECVPYYLCDDGVIITDGAGNIDVRILPQGTCINNEFPGIPSLCCLLPGATPYVELDKCPIESECVPPSLCNAKGEIITDGGGQIDIRAGHAQCYQPSGERGVCCYHAAPPPLEYCPQGSQCVSYSSCSNVEIKESDLALYPSHLWPVCLLDHGNTGICCTDPVVECYDSVCVPYGDCVGTARNLQGNFVDYDPIGSWAKCGYGRDFTAYGVCCIKKENPYPPPAEKCGVRNYQINQRIQSNNAFNEAIFGEFPWQGIIFYQNFTFNCGASLISNQHAITAAHCVDDVHAGDIKLRFGDWKVNSFEELLPYLDIDVRKIHLHKLFNPRNVHNDIAVLELIEPIPLEYHINTICLPTAHDQFYEGDDCITSGWGKDNFNGNFQTILKKIPLPFVEPKRCQNLLRKTRLGRFFRLDKSFTCAGGLENEDACFGDGGGPLICKRPSGQYVLTGITSWGIGCGQKDVPGVYADVKTFSTWVDDIIHNFGPVTNYGK